MTFYPEKGKYSIETFDSSEGAVFNDASLQGIIGGYVTLKSQLTGSTSYISPWNVTIDWTFEDNLYSISSVSGAFTITSGNISTATNTVSGYYGIAAGTTAWFFETDYPTYISGYGYSGRGDYAIGLFEDSPSGFIEESYTAGSQAITFEFDVASLSTYSGQIPLEGFSASGINLTGLPALTGIINHGLLFCDGTRWDYIEVTPYGIRSFNHPELAIPINLLTPKKVRVGFRGFDLFIATEDGKSVAGHNKFRTEISNPPTGAFAVFGAPTVDADYCLPNNILSGSVATYGKSLWDNIKILTGSMAIFQNSEIEQLYSTGYATMYTDVFDPGIYISKYLSANIGYVPFQGGETIVSAQYSGTDGWSTHDSVTLTTGQSKQLDLTDMPVFTYARSGGGTDYLSNPIRFKIDQRSFLGDKLPPAVEYIEVFATKTNLQIDMLPDWKQVGTSATVKFYVQTGTFLSSDPVPDVWTSFLFNTPLVTGLYFGASAFEDESKLIPISVVGTGEVSLRGPFGASFKTFAETSKQAISGSDAFDVFGGNPVYNFFPNPLFSEGFSTLASGDPNFYTGLTEGEIARNLQLASSYTGSHNIVLSKKAVYRPETQARVNKINSYLGRTSSPSEEYLQSTLILNNGNIHDGTVGIEAVIPSGIATGDLRIAFDIQIPQGTGIEVSLIGSTVYKYSLPGEYFRDYKSISLPYYNSNDYEFYVRFNVPSGYPSDTYEFNIDNLTVGASTYSYLSATGISGYLHRSGAFTPSVNDAMPRQAATIFNTAIYLHSYPEDSGVLLELTGVNSKGLSLYINSGGFVSAEIDTISNAISTGAALNFEPDFESIDRVTLVSQSRVPLGKWSSIGFMHDIAAYTGYSCVTHSGQLGTSSNFSINRAIITIDGAVSASYDMMSGFKSRLPLNRIYPYSSYIDLTGELKATIASGVQCEIDGVFIKRPPIGDVESDLTIKGARSYVPYMVPDSLYMDNNLPYNLLVTGLASYDSKSIGSCYNFSSPYYTHWDRGPLRNHLIYHGNISKQLLCPYSGQSLYSTRMTSGAYAEVPYSSAYEALTISTKQYGIVESRDSKYETSTIRALGWLYPRETGVFFSAVGNGDNKFDLVIRDNAVVFDKYGSAGSLLYSITGHQVTLSGWTFIDASISSPQHEVDLDNTAATVWIGNESGQSAYSLSTGVDYGMRYQSTSNFIFGGGADCNFFNWVLPIGNTGETTFERNLHGDHHKSGRWQAIVKDNILFTGTTYYPHYFSGLLLLGPGSTGEDYYFGLALHNSYDAIPRLQGLVAYDDKPFREVNSYDMFYNTESIRAAFGSTDSPIRAYRQVPNTAVNIARFTSPSFSVQSSIANIDLSDSNVHNLISYRNGSYEIGIESEMSNSVITGYKGINTPLYSGRFDATISGQVLSSDIELSTVAITDQKTNTYDKAYYYYLVGRGQRAVKTLGTYAHYTGQINITSTGSVVDNYTANLQRIKDSIVLKDSKGKEIDKQVYPYDIAISTYTPDDLYFSALSGQNIYLDNVGDYQSGTILPDNIFTVLLLTAKNRLPGQSVFVHYNAYDISSQEDIAGYKEIVNPQPIFREKQATESADIGKYSLSLNKNNLYDLIFHGLSTGFSGQL